MSAPRDGRTVTHYIGDGCPGNHPELLPATGPADPVDLDGLVADIITTLHGTSDQLWSWSLKAIAASDLLHRAGYHTAQMTQTDWRTCPVCSQHPERHAGGA